MGYTNSPLVNYTKISPNKGNNVNGKMVPDRTHAIDTITIHCVVGQASVETLGDIFANPNRGASSNYGVGTDGRIGMYVEEKDCSWCSSSAKNDNRAITIEVASDKVPPYAVNTKAFKSLIKLVADICKRNGIKELLWKNDPSLMGQVDKQNMTLHRWLAKTACPGEYLINKHDDIANEVNKLLKAETTAKTEPVYYRVQTGAYTNKANADRQLAKVKAAGFDTYMVKVDGYYKIQVGAYTVKKNAENMLSKVKAAGFSAFITTESGEAVSSKVSEPAKSNTALKVGDKVRLEKNAPIYGTTAKFQSWVYNSDLYVRKIDGNKVVISTLKTGAVTGEVDKKYLTKV